MLELVQVNKVYNRGKPSESCALKTINLKISQQDFVVLVGANGSGKSTLLNAVAGSILPDSGIIKIHNKEVQKLLEHERSLWISRVFQNPLAGTAPTLSILDNFRLAALRTQPKNLKIGTTASFKEKVKDHIAQLNLGLENKLDQEVGTLSGGQRQALTLLMSVMDDLDILLLDEPTAALDPRSAKMVMEITQKIITDYKLTAILVTHNLKEALHYGNRLIHLKEGEIKRDLDIAEKQNLQTEPLLKWFDYF